MTINALFKQTIPCVLLLVAACNTDNQANRNYQKYSDYNFEDTLMNLDVAIAEHNYRLIHRSHIGKAVRDRGNPSHPLSTITNFCNINYAKEMMSINPDLINDMPCNIAVREQDNKVIVSSQLMQTNVGSTSQQAFAEKINTNLKAIIESTVE